MLPRPSVTAGVEGDDQFRLLVASVRDYAIFLLDTDGTIVTWNVGAERIKGYTAHEAIGKNFSVFYPPEDLAAGKPAWELREAARDGRFEDEGWRLRKDGSRFWANVVITALYRDDGVLQGFGKVTRDLTARREAEETARRLAAEQAARAIAEKAETYQRHLLAIVGHDLRNCLSVVLTSGEMLRLYPLDPEKASRRATQIVNSAKRMRHIIASIIDYTHVQQEEGLGLSLREGVDFHAVCERVLQEYRVVYPDRQVRYEAEGNPLGTWDAGRLEQLVQNLVGNALQHGSPDSPVDLRWWREGEEAEGDLILRVHNDGPPIPPAVIPHIFESFYSGRHAGSAGATDSMGLGLFIVREIVRGHGGEVAVESDERRGTTFTVRLPTQLPGAGSVTARK